ncbi:MAG: hypothetical protein RLZZ316_479 [Bacteroidota bacterium]
MKKYILFFILLTVYCAAIAQNDSGYYASFDGVKIYYETMGSGRPVLLLHGFTNRGADWKRKPLCDSLVAHGYRVVLPDLRGNGKSGQPPTAAAYANDAEAKDLIGLLRFLKIKHYDAVGYSRGSIILARLLVTDKRLQKAVLGGMGADFTNAQWPRRIAFYNALINDTVKGFDDFRKYIASKGLSPMTLAWQQLHQPSTSKESLATVKKKVLVICGNQDADNGTGESLQQLIPAAVLSVVPGNHNSAWGTPVFAKNVIDFLQKKDNKRQ